MMMLFQLAVEPFLCSHTFDLLNQPAGTQQFQIPVDRTKAYAGRTAPDRRIDFACRRMVMGLFQNFQNHLPLGGHSEARLGRHSKTFLGR
jgi:hypothetical protein